MTEKNIVELRETVKASLSGKRSFHTLAVEQMAMRLGQIYAPDEINTLRAAALLHDITKEFKTDEQLKLCEVYGIKLTDNDILAPKTLHARTAAEKIKRDFTDFADQKIIDAVRWHTTGRAGMSITEKLIYLADYIDDSRKFEDCVKLRDFFFNFDFDSANDKEKLAHLRDTLILSYDMTISALLDSGVPVAKETFDARNELVCEKLKANL